MKNGLLNNPTIALKNHTSTRRDITILITQKEAWDSNTQFSTMQQLSTKLHVTTVHIKEL
jgi:hypothetical protein